MKILCPIDFSDASVNAAEYAAALFSRGGNTEIELIHCINVASRASMFVKIDDLLHTKAEEDIKLLVDKLTEQYTAISFSTKVVNIDPKHHLPKYAEREKFDFVVTGTTGMTQLKDITIGSLTEALFENSVIPVLAVPNGLTYRDMESVVVALDANAVDRDDLLEPLKYILTIDEAMIHMCHVAGDNPDIEYDPSIDVMLSDFQSDYTVLEKGKDSLGKTLHDFVDNKNSDLLVFIHHQRTWWERLFKSSYTKSELYNISTPLLILRD